ncbi:hypothetical protein SUGI_1155000 [Cryptomeria japonica]|nr:hypothetical protein SUGI_1155000 [Cryptomeria japonica]
MRKIFGRIAKKKKPNVSPELQYKFAPDLIMLDPYEIVEPWMVASNSNPRRLIPALNGGGKEGQQAVVAGEWAVVTREQPGNALGEMEAELREAVLAGPQQEEWDRGRGFVHSRAIGRHDAKVMQRVWKPYSITTICPSMSTALILTTGLHCMSLLAKVMRILSIS